MSHGYEVGSEHVRMLLGIEKTAVREVTPEEAGIGLSGAAAAGAGAAPFLGMIGQKKIRHDPLMGAQGQQFKTMRELSEAAQAGDIVLTAKPRGSIWRNFQLPASGSEWYHAQGVIGQRPSIAGSEMAIEELLEFIPKAMLEDTLGMSIEDLDELSSKKRKKALAGLEEALAKETGLTLEAAETGMGRRQVNNLMDKSSPMEVALEHGGPVPITKHMAGRDYKDVMLLRPKTPMTPEQLKIFQRQMMERGTQAYSNPKALELYLKDMFVPKIEGMQHLMGSQEINCKGNVCSTMPAQSMHEASGLKVVPGKRPQDIAPADYLRSDKFELVGSRMDPKKFRMSPGMRKAVPYLYRGGIGATLAAGTYGAMEEPELMAGAAGAAGAYSAGKKHAPKLAPMLGVAKNKIPLMFPDFKTGFGIVGAMANPQMRATVKAKDFIPMLKGGVPAVIGGGALAYGGAKGLTHLYDKHVADSMPWNE